jgi:hypothetical protein
VSRAWPHLFLGQSFSPISELIFYRSIYDLPSFFIFTQVYGIKICMERNMNVLMTSVFYDI